MWNVLAGRGSVPQTEETASAEGRRHLSTASQVLCGWSTEGWDLGAKGREAGSDGTPRGQNGSCGIVYVSS